jgi:DNA-binding CsgD family transcriptional regulator/DNA-binding transcriptional regulator YhcF (GntR family)
MTATGQPTSEAATGSTPLAAVGIGWLEEQVYRQLLTCPHASVTELAAATGAAYGRTRRAITNLERAGLLSRQRGSPTRYVPAPPDLAVQALVSRRVDELERAQLHARSLLEAFQRRVGSATELVEIITGTEAIHQRSLQLIKGAAHEVMMFDKPPYIGSLDNPVEYESLGRGIKWRAVYALDALQWPGQTERLERLRLAGEDARASAQVELKLAIADRKLALLPLTVDDESADNTAILVHPCSLLSTLVMLFETLWATGIPVPVATIDGHAGTPLRPGDAELVQLLAAGLKDEAIARNLGLSLRTVRRRIAALTHSFGVATRFQLGLAVAQLECTGRGPSDAA